MIRCETFKQDTNLSLVSKSVKFFFSQVKIVALHSAETALRQLPLCDIWLTAGLSPVRLRPVESPTAL